MEVVMENGGLTSRYCGSKA